MLPRRHSKRATPNPISPPLTSDSISGKRPLNPVTHHHPFRASTAQTVGTESPVPEILPVPPRPVSFLPSPPSSSGPRRQQTRYDTLETSLSLPFEECVQPQPPNVTSIPTPSVSQTHQPAPGGGVGGFEPIPKPTALSDSSLPPYETAGISEGPHAGIWATYNKVSQEFDGKRLEKWNEDLNVLLIFSSLFSAIVTAFLIRSLDDLQPNYQQQTALLLHQLLNGRDPNLANISDPTISKKPAVLAIAVNCLWCASLTISLGSSIYAMSFKWWLTGYNGGADPVGGLLRACQRHMQFMVFERFNVPARLSLLPTLILQSTLLFFMGGVIYLWQFNKVVMSTYAMVGGTIIVAYNLLFVLPSMKTFPLFHYPTFISYRPSFAIGKVVIFIAGVFVRSCCLALRCATAVIFPLAHNIFGTGAFDHWYRQTQTTSPGEHKDMHVLRTIALDNPPDGIDISQEAQEDAILWLSRVPLDPPESRALVSSLAMISASRPCGAFQKPVVVLANSVLKASFHKEVDQEQIGAAIDCVLILGNIKFQLAVDRNSDCDHNIGGIPVLPFVALAAQQLTISAFEAGSETPHSRGIRGRLLTAAAWLSPVDGAEDDVSWDGQELKIQDRWQFVEEIRMVLERHVRSEKPLDNETVINLIHGMHACIPRGNYGSASSIVPFPSFFCEDYDWPWSEDEGVLRALITYALDLVLPPERRKPLVNRRIRFDDLASELIDALMANTTHSDVVAFAFWFACRVPYIFRSRKTVLTDIAYIWLRTTEAIAEDYHGRLNFHAIDAFIAVAQHHVVVNGGLPRLTDYTSLKLLSSALESGYSRPMTIYTMAMILNLQISTSSQVTTVTNEIEVGSIIHALFSGRGDLEKGEAEKDVVDTRIYSTLILHKFLPTVELDVEKVKGLIVQTEEAIGEPFVGDPEVAKSSKVEVGINLDRERWKAIYLLALLFRFLPGGERENYIEGLRTRVRVLLESGGLSFMGDCGRCLEPLGMNVSGLTLATPAADRQGQMDTIFGMWIGGFPLFQLAGAASEPPPGQNRSRLSFFNPKRLFR